MIVIYVRLQGMSLLEIEMVVDFIFRTCLSENVWKIRSKTFATKCNLYKVAAYELNCHFSWEITEHSQSSFFSEYLWTAAFL